MDSAAGQAMQVDLGAVYAEQRQRIGELVRSLPEADLLRRLPSCPDWTVRDVIGHMAGLMADVSSGNTAGMGTSEWTQAQVEAFDGHGLGAVLDEWAQLSAVAEKDFEGTVGPGGVRMISDAFTHEHDIRGAVDRPGGRESAAMAVALRLQLDTLGTRLTDAGLPALELRCSDGGSFVAGSGAPAGAVCFPSTWEMLRTVTARRSRAQLQAQVWEGVAAQDYLAAFFRFEPPAQDILE